MTAKTRHEVLGWVGGIDFRLGRLALSASLSLLPGSKLPEKGLLYPSPSLPLCFYPRLLHFPPSALIRQDQTRLTERCGSPWQRGPSLPKQLEAEEQCEERRGWTEAERRRRSFSQSAGFNFQFAPLFFLCKWISTHLFFFLCTFSIIKTEWKQHPFGNKKNAYNIAKKTWLCHKTYCHSRVSAGSLKV